MRTEDTPQRVTCPSTTSRLCRINCVNPVTFLFEEETNHTHFFFNGEPILYFTNIHSTHSHHTVKTEDNINTNDDGLQNK